MKNLTKYYNFIYNEIKKFAIYDRVGNVTSYGILVLLIYIVPSFLINLRFHAPTQILILYVMSFISCIILNIAIRVNNITIRKYIDFLWLISVMFSLLTPNMLLFVISGFQKTFLMQLFLSLVMTLLFVNLEKILIIIAVSFFFGLYEYSNYFWRKVEIDKYNHAYYEDGYFFLLILCSLIFIILRGFGFNNKNNNLVAKIYNMKVFSSSIAHEVNKPIASIVMISNLISDIWNMRKKSNLIESENKVQATFEKNDFEFLSNVAIPNLEKISKNASDIIQFLLNEIHEYQQSIDTIERNSAIETVNETIKDFYLTPMKDRISFTCIKDFQYYGSKEMLKHVLYNLIQNAFLHGVKDTKIEITVYTQKIVCKNTGKTISAKMLKEIFHLFSTSSNKKHEGHGIGLAFCKMAMKTLGGTITCRSKDDIVEFCLNWD